MRTRCRKCFCMNNNYTNSNMMHSCEDVLEKKCNNICSNMQEEYNKNCSCGFDDDEMDVFPENPNLAQSYVPIQTMNDTFKPCQGLKCGTIFPELVSPYSPGDSMKQIEYLDATNNIGEGCNSNGRR